MSLTPDTTTSHLVPSNYMKDMDVFNTVKWKKCSAVIKNTDGSVVFEQHNIEAPESWSQLAIDIVASKYFRGPLIGGTRESSVKTLISRVANTITDWGIEKGYFINGEAETFRWELSYLLLHQHAAFNSPVWFNVGIEKEPQCSACFINSLEDTLDSILDLVKIEGMLFKYGSGAGVNLSPLRSTKESMSTGGRCSGPVSFMKVYDANANVIKSGGKVRRAAKMQVLNADHGDILDFIWCKVREESKAHALVDAGFDGALNGEAYSSIFFQNANLSVRVTDEFMRAVVEDKDWNLVARDGKTVLETIPARRIFRDMAEAAWKCGDPGIQFDTQTNNYHTCKVSGRINSTNPCGEYTFLDDTACNLSSLNLMKFRDEDGNFDTEGFMHAVRIMIIAKEIIVGCASYPTKKIEDMSHKFRTLGLGFANLGSLLMSYGFPYDSNDGRNLAAAITALMTGEAYAVSAELAGRVGAFSEFELNKESMLDVIHKHKANLGLLEKQIVTQEFRPLIDVAQESWDRALLLGRSNGYRNAQVSVIAPTGTIAFMMDCDTTGIEPDIALVKYKKLSGGGTLKIVNGTVPLALKSLGYSDNDIQSILDYIAKNETIEGSIIHDADLAVFDCAFPPRNGSRSISPSGHVEMMAAVQPFVSGGISKTVNMPSTATPKDIEDVYIRAWELGLKCITIYRDGCKRIQPYETSSRDKAEKQVAVTPKAFGPTRRRLPTDRLSRTHKFEIAGHEGYITVGLYDDGTPGEVFIKMAKAGSTIGGLVDAVATLLSINLQYGVPLKSLVDKFSHVKFEPSGFTKNPDITYASSIIDYIFRYLEVNYLKSVDSSLKQMDAAPKAVDRATDKIELLTGMKNTFVNQIDAPPCRLCGSILVRSASCYRCSTCGESYGCS